MAIDLTDRVCLVTGAGSGIGKAVAEGFAKRGAKVVATDINAPQIGSAAASLEWDVTDPQRALQVVQEVDAEFGRIDALIANAGIYPQQKVEEITVDDWRQVLAVNLDGPWFGAQAVAPMMQAQNYGKIVLVTSVEVLLGVDVHAHYDSAKMGLIGLTRSLSRALGTHGIRVNAIMPGSIQTEGELKQFPDQEAQAKRFDQLQAIPGRIPSQQIEPAFAFLCSDESDAITGQVVCVDKGQVFW
jgi:3-oxoacyl-[acyl-carrier protein] reductase